MLVHIIVVDVVIESSRDGVLSEMVCVDDRIDE